MRTVAASLLAASLLAGAAAAAPQKVVVKLVQEHGSRASGTATITPSGSSLVVDLKLTVPKKLKSAFFTAHVHTVTCAEYESLASLQEQASTVDDSLHDVLHATSRTKLFGDLASLQDGKHSINVHDPSYGFRTILCGDIPAAAG